MAKDGEKTSHQKADTKATAPLEKGYNIQIEVDDDDIITFTGKINPRHYLHKPANQIWSAMYSSARDLVAAWEAHYNE